MNVRLKDNLEVELTACDGKIVKERALALFALCDAYRNFAPHASQIMSRGEY